ncbi:hypothetical protein CMI38_07095 [Candidatus Pacearchaeota archaeon]|jgi:hypothetical protein|nr:hypothetical protein [Candidatus Pacearchaeota archaeon]|tara:strand:+ start:92 stop:646 length:555 start_codon:yes stop_codon:yes gene_type:complete
MEEETSQEKVINRAAEIIYDHDGISYYKARDMARRDIGLSRKRLPHLDSIYLRLGELINRRESKEERQSQLRQMREEALDLMSDLEEFSPKLIGSVWRGNVRKGSDIDLHTYSDNYKLIHKHLKDSHLAEPFNDHYLLKGQSKNYPVNITVYPTRRKGETQSCNILRTPLTGFSIDELRELLEI